MAKKGLLATLKGIVGVVAPTLATALGSPIAGGAMKMILGALGVTTERDAVDVLQNNPDALVKLKTAEMQYEKDMAELGVDVYKLDVEDRGSARTMAKTMGIWPQVALSVLFIGGYFWLLYMFFTGDFFTTLDDWAKGQLSILIGVITASMVQIMNFWFGSSKGSKDKTDKLGAAI